MPTCSGRPSREPSPASNADSSPTAIARWTNSWRPPKKLFADCQTRETVQAGNSENRDAVLEEFRKNPNIRVVVSCTRVVGVEYFSLPMNDPQLSAVFDRLDELGEGMYSLGIEACRYKDHWPDTFGEVLREEGLFALNALAAAFPPMEDYDKFCAVVEYADANSSKEYIALADHLDEFEFFPGARDLDDMAETWIDTHPYGSSVLHRRARPAAVPGQRGGSPLPGEKKKRKEMYY